MSLTHLQALIFSEQAEAAAVTKDAIERGRPLLEAMSQDDLVEFANGGVQHDASEGHCLRCVAWFLYVGRSDYAEWVLA